MQSIKLKSKALGTSLLELLVYLTISSIVMVNLIPKARSINPLKFRSKCVELQDFINAAKAHRSVNLESIESRSGTKLIAHTPTRRLSFSTKYQLKLKGDNKESALKYDLFTYAPQRISLYGESSACSVIISLRGRIRLTRNS